MATKTLDILGYGHTAKIIQLKKNAMPFRSKLLAMGVVPGALVKVIRAAPLGDPLEIEICGFHLCLRRSEAATIDVEEC